MKFHGVASAPSICLLWVAPPCSLVLSTDSLPGLPGCSLSSVAEALEAVRDLIPPREISTVHDKSSTGHHVDGPALLRQTWSLNFCFLEAGKHSLMDRVCHTHLSQCVDPLLVLHRFVDKLLGMTCAHFTLLQWDKLNTVPPRLGPLTPMDCSVNYVY